MSNFNKFKTNSYCVGGRHYSGTDNVRWVVSAKGTKMLKGFCATCRRNKSMTVSDATMEAEGLKDLFKSVAALAATPDLSKFATTGEGVKVVQKGRGLYLDTKKT